MSGLNYTHKEMVEICDEAKRMMIEELESMIEMLGRDVSGKCVWVHEIARGISEIKANNGLEGEI